MPRKGEFAPRLYPLAPLLDVARRYRYVSKHRPLHHLDPLWDTTTEHAQPPADATTIVVEVCGLSGKQVTEARSTGLTEAQADRCAMRLGVHPNDVWGWDWWDGEGARDRTDIVFAALRRESA